MKKHWKACLDLDPGAELPVASVVWKLSSSALAVMCIIALPAQRQEH